MRGVGRGKRSGGSCFCIGGLVFALSDSRVQCSLFPLLYTQTSAEISVWRLEHEIPNHFISSWLDSRLASWRVSRNKSKTLTGLTEILSYFSSLPAWREAIVCGRILKTAAAAASVYCIWGTFFLSFFYKVCLECLCCWETRNILRGGLTVVEMRVGRGTLETQFLCKKKKEKQ